MALELGVPLAHVTALVIGDPITAEMAIMLGQRFDTSAEFWLNLQMKQDLEKARERMRRAT